jgi:glycosyltransferase involved in cell wall biosynthesis
MPVFNGLDYVDQSLPPLLAMRERGEVAEVIVVDDGSTDATPQRCRELGATVMDSGGRLGPGGARNRAAQDAAGELLWFVDADVVVHDDAARALVRGFSSEDILAVFGSYDDQPPAMNFFSQYKNLVHHHYHQRARDEAQTFWSGCGAVRRDAFLAQGGFDVDRYPRPSIEDIELGHRIVSTGGRIRLLRDLQCTHLKVWRFGNLVHTEVFCRAIPWSRLMLTSSGVLSDLNTGPAEQFRALVAGLLLLALVAALAGLVPAWLPLLAMVVAVLVNLDLARLFLARRGPLFALRGMLFHQIYYLYSGAAFAWVALEQAVARLTGVRRR